MMTNNPQTGILLLMLSAGLVPAVAPPSLRQRLPHLPHYYYYSRR